MSIWLHEPAQKDLYPTMRALYCLACCWPVSTASCERNFSSLKIIKTRLRSTISDKWMDDLLALYMEKDLVVAFEDGEIERVIDAFLSTDKWRIQYMTEE